MTIPAHTYSLDTDPSWSYVLPLRGLKNTRPIEQDIHRRSTSLLLQCAKALHQIKDLTIAVRWAAVPCVSNVLEGLLLK